jgi:starch synthase
MLKILAAASEIFPLVKTGGLADVVGALPAALRPHGVAVKTLVPGYPAILAALENRTVVHKFAEMFGGAATLLAGEAKGLELLVLDAPHLFGRPGNPYLGPDGKDWPDNAQRFAAFARAAAEICRGLVPAFIPDILHAHDWQAALAPAYLKFGPACATKSVVTIHNLAFQGLFPAAMFKSLGLPAAAYAIDGVEYYGGVGYLKGGLQYADAITTVSPSYAREICTKENGMGLDGLLRARQNVLSGIVNGIDITVWDPATDSHIASTYDVKRLARRAVNKRAVERRFGFEVSHDLTYCIVSRLTEQKGMDLVAQTIDTLVGSGARLALLGSGDGKMEASFNAAAKRHPGRVGAVIGYDEALSHLLQAGSDAILIPSRFEPCGLTQLYGLRYGCIPVVSRVGGLADTIVDANDAGMAAGVATGVQFAPTDAPSYVDALGRTAALFRDQRRWREMQRCGMRADVSWQRSAAQYAALFRSLSGAEEEPQELSRGTGR